MRKVRCTLHYQSVVQGETKVRVPITDGYPKAELDKLVEAHRPTPQHWFFGALCKNNSRWVD
jgi:hypothetical protein